MRGNQNYLVNFEYYPGGHVTFEDEKKGSILGRGTLDVPGLPKSKNVTLVKGLKVNIMSISQQRDQVIIVNFTKDRFEVSSKTKEKVME